MTNLPPLETPLFELIWPNGQRWTLRLNGQIDGLADDTNVGIINHAMPLVYALAHQAKQVADSQAQAEENKVLTYQATQEAMFTSPGGAESTPSSTSKFPEHQRLIPWTHPEGDAKPPLELLQTLGGRILAIHQELLRCTQLGMQLPAWSDLDSLLHPADSNSENLVK